jgi:hypothetical protein
VKAYSDLFFSISVLNAASSKFSFHGKMARLAGKIPVQGHGSDFVK